MDLLPTEKQVYYSVNYYLQHKYIDTCRAMLIHQGQDNHTGNYEVSCNECLQKSHMNISRTIGCTVSVINRNASTQSVIFFLNYNTMKSRNCAENSQIQLSMTWTWLPSCKQTTITTFSTRTIVWLCFVTWYWYSQTKTYR